MTNKLHFGLICNHVELVVSEHDAFCVECSDGVVDICSECFTKQADIKNTNNPYDVVSDYWFAGTMRELVGVINRK
jgi:hypothetical protein